jgi:hypothetical protein
MGDESLGANILEPLAYHRLVVDYLRDEEPEIWAWGCSPLTRAEQVDPITAGALFQAAAMPTPSLEMRGAARA